ncbi:MAG: hypothetical protein GY777_10345 [Candidatus Brocadiaceae bacterium]|nr:hypothetical protein [Candidatus Brocadiaceae bacterium]MCP5005435.1 hypothetical protein [Planctomycetota bacterium]
MAKRISEELLRKLRNDIPIEILIAQILKIPSKYSEGYFRFLCPICNEFNTATKKQTNLARCFRCNKNFNPIDLVMSYHEITFLDTVKFLMPALAYFNRVS